MSRVRRVPSGARVYYQEQVAYDRPPTEYPASINVLKGLAWIWLGTSILVCVVLLVGLETTLREQTSISNPFLGAADISGATVGAAATTMLVIFAQGLLVWAVLSVLATIAQTLIDIRDRS